MKKEISALFSELNEIAKDGAIVVVKIDGVRVVANEPDIFTVMVSGGLLDSEDFFRKDSGDLIEAMQSAIAFYAANRKAP